MNPFSGQVRIGSPAISNGIDDNKLMGIHWLEQFFIACNSLCAVDFVAFHWHNDDGQLANLLAHVANVTAIAARNGISAVWLTEFG
jgi:hypothetical protein